MKQFFNLGRKLLVCALLAALVTSYPASVMAAEVTTNVSQVAVSPAELGASYSQLVSAENTIMPRTSYFITDQEFSFTGTYITYGFNIPYTCQARLVIAAIGNEPLYINVLNSKGVSVHTITVTPNQSQVHAFNINAGDYSLRFSSISASTFTVRMQMYTWDY